MMTYSTDTRYCTQIIEPPCTERYARWCERSATQLMGSLLLDSCFSLIQDKPLSLYGTSGSSYILETREVLRLLHREFVYVGDPVPELNEQEHAAFLMNIQKSILLSLEKRKLLTHSQRERCLVELEKQYSREQKSRRRA